MWRTMSLVWSAACLETYRDCVMVEEQVADLDAEVLGWSAVDLSVLLDTDLTAQGTDGWGQTTPVSVRMSRRPEPVTVLRAEMVQKRRVDQTPFFLRSTMSRTSPMMAESGRFMPGSTARFR
jgi:hypothetical protein